MRLIQGAAVKHQCSGDYFYGDDQKLEVAIQATEGAYSTVLRDLLIPGKRPTNAHKHLMRLFWFFQYMRTEAAARKSIEMLDSLGERFSLAPEDFNMGIKEAVHEAMHVFIEEMQVIEDMSVAFGKNKTTAPLMTSDNPAVLCNRWIREDPHCSGMSIGLVSAGNMMVVPLTPNVVFVGYDSGVYSIPKDRGWFSIAKEEDIHAFNQLQVLCCNANLYVPPGCHERSLSKMVNEVKARRPVKSHETQYFVKDAEYPGINRWCRVASSDIGEDQEILVQVKPVHPKPLTWPSCVKWRTRGKVYADGSSVGYVRGSVASSKSDRPFHSVSIRRGRVR